MKYFSVRKLMGIVVCAGILLFAAVGNAAVYWDPGVGMQIPVPATYYFRPNNTGVRTTYPSGNLEFGQPEGFAWVLNQNNVLLIQYPSGYTQALQLLAYDSAKDTYILQGYDREQRASNWPWYGCISGQMPPLLVATLCQ